MKRPYLITCLLAGALWWPALAPSGSAVAQPIAVQVYVVEGSVWDGEAGRERINKAVVEARRIWFAGAGVKLSIKPERTRIKGRADALTKDDIAGYARTLQAAARNVVVVFTDKSWSISRAWTEAPLVAAGTPVIVVGRQVYDKPGTYRDLAHELGHVLLRDPDHSPGLNDLMNITWAPNNGDVVTAAQKAKALQYPH